MWKCTNFHKFFKVWASIHKVFNKFIAKSFKFHAFWRTLYNIINFCIFLYSIACLYRRSKICIILKNLYIWHLWPQYTTRVKVVKQSSERSDIFQLCFAVEHYIGICTINKFPKSITDLLKLLFFYIKCFQDSGTFWLTSTESSWVHIRRVRHYHH